MQLNEGLRKLPSLDELKACPSIFKMIDDRHLNSFLENGFQRELAGDNGECYGEGVYCMLYQTGYGGSAGLSGGYGHTQIVGKELGSFRDYVICDFNFPIETEIFSKLYGENSDRSLRSQLVRVARRNHPDWSNEEISVRVNQVISGNRNNNDGLESLGVRGKIFQYGSGPAVLPFDFSSIVIYGYVNNVYPNITPEECRKRFVCSYGQYKEKYENQSDWTHQAQGLYKVLNKSNAVEFNGKLYCQMQKKENNRWVFFVPDTHNTINPKPSFFPKDFDFDDMPSNIGANGTFMFRYKGLEWFGAVSIPDEDSPVLWFPPSKENENIPDKRRMFSPDVNDSDSWAFLDSDSIQYAANARHKYGLFENNESNKEYTKKSLKEEIDSNNEREFLDRNRTYVYRASNYSHIKSIFENGQLREFASSNDGSWYGDGVYAVLNPNKVQYWKYDKERGSCGVKMIVNGGFGKFLIFDEHWASVVYGGNHSIKDQVYRLFPKEVADDVWNDFSGWQRRGLEGCQNDLNPNAGRTTGLLHIIFNSYGHSTVHDPKITKKYENLFSKYGIKGAIYNGGNDGLSMVCWRFNEIIPFEYTTDGGRTWNRDLFDFNHAKDLTFKNNDPISKFRHLFKYIDNTGLVFCDINGIKMNVTVVQCNNGLYNIIDVNSKGTTEEEVKLIPFDLREVPSISSNGLFTFNYKGFDFWGTVNLPGDNIPAVWFPENGKYYSTPDVNSGDDWIGFGDINYAVKELS